MQKKLEEGRFAVISDIHGNIEALEVALKIIRENQLREVLFLGDLVGYYYSAVECLEKLNAFNFFAVKGNHEDMYLDLRNQLIESSFIDQKYGSALRRAVLEADKKLDIFIESLPLTLSLDYNGNRLLLAHGDFKSNTTYVYPDLSKEMLADFDKLGYDYIFLGNTHHQMMRVGKKATLVNPGSVGMCRSKPNNVQFAICDLNTNSVNFFNVPYCPQTTLQQVNLYDPFCSFLLKSIK